MNAPMNSPASSQTPRKQKTSIKGVPDLSLTVRPIPIERLDLHQKGSRSSVGLTASDEPSLSKPWRAVPRSPWSGEHSATTRLPG